MNLQRLSEHTDTSEESKTGKTSIAGKGGTMTSMLRMFLVVVLILSAQLATG
jgi:hypothetical protein